MAKQDRRNHLVETIVNVHLFFPEQSTAVGIRFTYLHIHVVERRGLFKRIFAGTPISTPGDFILRSIKASKVEEIFACSCGFERRPHTVVIKEVLR